MEFCHQIKLKIKKKSYQEQNCNKQFHQGKRIRRWHNRSCWRTLLWERGLDLVQINMNFWNEFYEIKTLNLLKKWNFVWKNNKIYFSWTFAIVSAILAELAVGWTGAIFALERCRITFFGRRTTTANIIVALDTFEGHTPPVMKHHGALTCPSW